MISEKALNWVKAGLRIRGLIDQSMLLLEITPNDLKDRAGRPITRLVGVLGANGEELRHQISELIEPENYHVTGYCFAPRAADLGYDSQKLMPYQNWRGRVLTMGDLAAQDVLPRILQSSWRIFVTRRTLITNQPEFFVRHDIYPFLYSPGYSSAGEPVWETGVNRSFDFCWQHRDPHWDNLRLVRGHTSEPETTTRYAEIVMINFRNAEEANARNETLEAFRYLGNF